MRSCLLLEVWTIVIQLVNGGKVEKKKKYIQFVAIWHLLKQSHPMTDFELD
jgi:hypothetical protein